MKYNSRSWSVSIEKLRLFDFSVGVYNPSSPVPGNSSTVIYKQTSQQSPKADLGNANSLFTFMYVKYELDSFLFKSYNVIYQCIPFLFYSFNIMVLTDDIRTNDKACVFSQILVYGLVCGATETIS